MREMTYADWQHVPNTDRIGTWFQDAVTWLEDNVGPFFDFVEDVIDSFVTHLTDALQWPPATVMIVIFALLSLITRGWQFALATLIGFALIDSMEEFDPAMQTLALVVIAALIAVVIAIPIGILAARNATTSRVVQPILDLMQTMPAFVYLIPAISFFSIGPVPGVVSTVVFALPPGVRLTELGIRQVDPEMVEAGEAFGSSPMKVLTGIQIPLAMPSIMAGINQVIMLSLSMVVIGGMVGAPGLGQEVFTAVTRIQLDYGFEAGISVVVLAIFLDRITSAVGDRAPVARAAARAAM